MERDNSRFTESRPSSAESEGSASNTSKKVKEKQATTGPAIASGEVPVIGAKTESAARLGSLWERMLAKPEMPASTELPKRSEPESDTRHETAEESDDDIAHLDEAEKRSAVASILNEELAEVRTQQATREDGAPEGAADEAVVQFLEQADTALHAEAPSEAAMAVEQAYEDTLLSLGFEQGNNESDGLNPGTEIDDDEDFAAARLNQGARGVYGGSRLFGGSGYDSTGGTVPIGANHARVPTNTPESTINSAESHAALGGFIVGGIVGYLLGRRRGRIKTEERLKPIQQKLEAQVGMLYANVAAKEAHIRELVVEREQARHQEQAVPVVEAGPAAKPASGAAEKLSATETKEPVRLAPANAEKMDIREVLEISNEIVIGATTVRKIFETNLISERGLRRVVNEFLRGGNHLPILAAELAAKDRDHELDPRLRDRPPDVSTAGSTVQPAQSVAAPAGRQTVAGVSAGAVSPAQAAGQGLHTQSSQHTMAMATVMAFVILGALLLILFAIWLLR